AFGLSDLGMIVAMVRPSVERLARMATSRRQSSSQLSDWSNVASKVVDAAERLTGGDNDVRAVLFYARDDGDVRTLSVMDYAGSSHPSQREFRDGPDDLAGQEVWADLEDGKVVTWPDLAKKPPSTGLPRVRVVRTARSRWRQFKVQIGRFTGCSTWTRSTRTCSV